MTGFDEQFSPAERVLGGRDGQVPEEAGDALDGHAGPVRPRHGREHFVALQEARVRLPEREAAPLDARQFHQPVVGQYENFTYRDHAIRPSASLATLTFFFRLCQITSLEKVNLTQLAVINYGNGFMFSGYAVSS